MQQIIKPQHVKQEIKMDSPKLPKQGERSYWVINGHASYFGKKTVQSKHPTYFFTQLGSVFCPDHDTFKEIKELTWRNSQAYDDQYSNCKRATVYPILARTAMYDYFIEYCKKCGAYSGIFHVTIEYTDYGDSAQSTPKTVTKYDLSSLHSMGVGLFGK